MTPRRAPTGSAASGAVRRGVDHDPAQRAVRSPARRRGRARRRRRRGSAEEAAAAEPLGAVTPCSDRAKQIPKDPYSPPCLAFTGNNGGATARGVTKDTIRVGIRFPADPIDFGQAYQFLADHGIHETREDLERTALGLLEYFNATFQFYGRRIEPVLWQGSGLAAHEILGGGQDAANADAIKAATELNDLRRRQRLHAALRRRAGQAGRRGRSGRPTCPASGTRSGRPTPGASRPTARS